MKMEQPLAEYVNNEKLAVVAVPIDDRGNLHSAAIHYAYNPQAMAFYFVTERDSEKCTLLRSGQTIKAACVIGLSVGCPYTLQMRGHIKITEPTDQIKAAIAAKRGGRTTDDLNDAKNVVLEFLPNWGRYTDYSIGFDAHRFLEFANAK